MGSNFISERVGAVIGGFLACCRELKRPLRRNRWWRDWSGRFWSDREAPTNQRYEPCIRCVAKTAVRAFLLTGRGSGLPAFIPEGCRPSDYWLGVRFYDNPFLACLNCGLVWSQVDPEDFRRYVEKYGGATKSPVKAFDDF